MVAKYIFKKKLNNFLVTIFDVLGGMLFVFFKIFKKRSPGNVGNILIIRLDHIGDVIFSTPVPQNLKNHYKGAKITFLAGSWAKEIVINNPYIDEVICYDAPWFSKKSGGLSGILKLVKLCAELKKHNYDVAFDLRGDLRSILIMAASSIKFRVGFGVTGGAFLLHKEVEYRHDAHSLERNLDALRAMKISIVSSKPQLYSSARDKETVKALMQRNSLDKENSFAIVHPFSRNISKNWLDKRFARLITILGKDYGLRTVLIGSNEDRENIENLIRLSSAEAVNIAGDISLGALSELLKKASFFIGVDSSPSHIAALSSKPSVILYSGTNNPDEWAPINEKTVIIQKDISCKGCGRTDCRHNICMDLISVDDVMEAVKQVAGSVIASEAPPQIYTQS